ncbi:hypothetical protein EJB05_44762, partial [Eragrostis curvula]
MVIHRVLRCASQLPLQLEVAAQPRRLLVEFKHSDNPGVSIGSSNGTQRPPRLRIADLCAPMIDITLTLPVYVHQGPLIITDK